MPSSPTLALASAALLFATLPGGRASAGSVKVAPAAPPPIRGVALGLFSEDPDWSYGGLLDEIAALGANEVELVVPWYQRDVLANEVHLHPRFSPTEREIARAVDEAHERGLHVLLFPIVRLEVQRSSSDWRGTLAPSSREAWFHSYATRLVALARLAATHRVEALSIGSELSTLDTDPAPWREVVRSVRLVYRGSLTYSGNWDHYQQVALYPLVDLPGLCGYFALGGPAADDPPALTRAWRERRAELEAFFAARGHGRFLFTEIGYRSRRGSHAAPWDEGSPSTVDLDEQLRCYRAFVSAWSGAPQLAGVFFWNWFGWGGRTSDGYTPRGKPAASVIAAWYGRPSGPTLASEARR